jgi:hypothetical protein
MEYFLNRYEIVTKHTTECTLTKTFGLIEFGSIISKLLHFFPETHVFD